MTELMEAKTVRLTINVSEELREALKVEATVRGIDMGDLASQLLEPQLTDSLERVRARRASSERRERRKS